MDGRVRNWDATPPQTVKAKLRFLVTSGRLRGHWRFDGVRLVIVVWCRFFLPVIGQRVIFADYWYG